MDKLDFNMILDKKLSDVTVRELLEAQQLFKTRTFEKRQDYRRAIYDGIKDHPDCTIYELSKILAISQSLIRYHVKRFEASGKVLSIKTTNDKNLSAVKLRILNDR